MWIGSSVSEMFGECMKFLDNMLQRPGNSIRPRTTLSHLVQTVSFSLYIHLWLQ